MTGHPGRAKGCDPSRRPSAGGRDGGAYRITVRGVMSERFCRGSPGCAATRRADRTVLEGGLPRGVRVNDVLARLGNLGVEVLDGRAADAAPRPTPRTLMATTRHPRNAPALAGHRLAVALPRARRRRRWSRSPPTSPPADSRTRAPSSSRRATASRPRPGPTPSRASSRWSQPGSARPLRPGPRRPVERAAPRSPRTPTCAQVVTAFDGGGAGADLERRQLVLPRRLLRSRSATTPSGTPPRASATRSSAARCAVGGAAVVGERGRHDHRRGPRARPRADRVPDHLPAVALGLPRRDRGAAAVPDGRLVIFGALPGASACSTRAMTLSVYALNLAIGLSLGLAIDYSLLIISRYREEMAARDPGATPCRAPCGPPARACCSAR